MSLLRRNDDENKREETAPPIDYTYKPYPHHDLKYQIKTHILNILDPHLLDGGDDEVVRQSINKIFGVTLAEVSVEITAPEREELLNLIIHDVLGLGPLEPLMRDDSVSFIMVNDPQHIFYKQGTTERRASVVFDDTEHVETIFKRLIKPDKVNENSSLYETTLPDGSQLHAVLPPLSPTGIAFTVRKSSQLPLTVKDLIQNETLSPEIAEFLRACVIAGINMIVCGSRYSGKTTMLNMLASFIPKDERIITVETFRQLQLSQDNVVPIKFPTSHRTSENNLQHVLPYAVDMKPDKLIVDDCTLDELPGLLRIMGAGNSVITTVYTDYADRYSMRPKTYDAILRLESQILSTGSQLPVRAIREQIVRAVDVIIHLKRFNDGLHRITHITQMDGMTGDDISLADIFEFVFTPKVGGKIQGYMRGTGVIPRGIIERIEDTGINLPPATFGRSRRRQDVQPSKTDDTRE